MLQNRKRSGIAIGFQHRGLAIHKAQTTTTQYLLGIVYAQELRVSQAWEVPAHFENPGRRLFARKLARMGKALTVVCGIHLRVRRNERALAAGPLNKSSIFHFFNCGANRYSAHAKLLDKLRFGRKLISRAVRAVGDRIRKRTDNLFVEGDNAICFNHINHTFARNQQLIDR